MPSSTTEAEVSTMVTTVNGAAGMDMSIVSIRLINLMLAGGKADGFWSAEIIPPSTAHPFEWKLIERFSNSSKANSCKQSKKRSELLADLSAPGAGCDLKVEEIIIDTGSTFGSVGTAIVTNVKQGMEAEYFDWECKIQSAQAKYKGYHGTYWQPPAPGRSGQWTTMVRFDTPENLEQWFASDERKELLVLAEKFVERTEFKKMSSSFPGWVPLDKETGQPPPNWKTAMLVLLGLFPVVMLEIRFLNPLLVSLNSSVGSFIGLVGSVLATTFGTMPRFVKWFSWWLFPKKGADSSVHLRGTMIVMALYICEILALWNLLNKR